MYNSFPSPHGIGILPVPTSHTLSSFTLVFLALDVLLSYIIEPASVFCHRFLYPGDLLNFVHVSLFYFVLVHC
jgi:hypothetical protein